MPSSKPFMISIQNKSELKYSDLSISLPEVLQAMGCDSAFTDSSLEFEIDSLLNQLHTILRPRFQYFTSDGHIDSERKLLSIGEISFSMGSIISRQLLKSQSFLFFVATAGQEFEEWQQSPSIKGDILKSYIADTLGSIIAEKSADAMERVLETALESDSLRHTNRYSPGYCGWHVSQQKLLFSLFEDEKPCGVTLTDSSLMLPIKSVSGVIGIGKDVRKLDYTCGLCSLESCFRRKR